MQQIKEIQNPRKYFSYVEVIENPNICFSNGEDDSNLTWDKDVFELTFKDFSFFMNEIKKKHNSLLEENSK